MNPLKILQISIEVNSNSVGRIAEQIGSTVIANGWESYITYARNYNPSKSTVIKIGSLFDVFWHGIETRIFDNHGFSSRRATRRLIKQIEKIGPDVIHLHHLHGYFINIEILFNYLSKVKTPIVWTFHDCWAFTGHCAHFEYVGCNKWMNGCFNCEQKFEYPKSLVFDRSKRNFHDKNRIFNSVDNMVIVPVSNWLGDLVKQSFLKKFPINIIRNGIDINVFHPKKSRREIDEKYKTQNKFLIIGVASTWDKKKGLEEFVKLNTLLSSEFYQILLVGLSITQIKSLPKSFICVERTENVDQLADLYAAADVFINPTLEDTYPTTNLEAMSCGTPVITYRTGGSVESVDDETGLIVEKNDLQGMVSAIEVIRNRGKSFYENNCRKKAELQFDKKEKFSEYISIYKQLLNNI